MTNEENNKTSNFKDPEIQIDSLPKSSNKSLFPIIAAIMLIIAGVLALITFIQFFTINVSTVESLVGIEQLESMNITSEQIINFLQTCGIIGCVISVFTILGGILSYKKKLWGIAVTCGIIGLFSLGIMFTSSILSFIALIFIILSKEEFQ